jgi:hypothetical protein
MNVNGELVNVLWTSLFQQKNIHKNIITMYMEIFIHMNDIFLPHGLNISSIWKKNLMDEIFCHVDEKYFHMVSEKKEGNEHKFWIFQNVELMKETKRYSHGKHYEIVSAHNNNWKTITLHNNLAIKILSEQYLKLLPSQIVYIVSNFYLQIETKSFMLCSIFHTLWNYKFWFQF